MTPLQKLPKNVGDLGKSIVAKGLKSCPNSKKLPNLVTQKGGHGVVGWIVIWRETFARTIKLINPFSALL